VMGMQLMAMRPPGITSARIYGNELGDTPNSFSGASQVTVVDPLKDKVRPRE
jgi:hypothetical protein